MYICIYWYSLQASSEAQKFVFTFYQKATHRRQRYGSVVQQDK